MERKILFVGDNAHIIDGFTKKKLSDKYSIELCTSNAKLIERSMIKFKPHIIVLCIGQSVKQNVMDYEQVKKYDRGNNTPIVLLGNMEYCDALVANTDRKLYSQILTRPTTLQEIEDTFYRFTKHLFNEEEIKKKKEKKPVEKKQILVVDDDIKLLKFINVMLCDTYDIALVKSGPMAMQFLQSNKPDLILLDYVMPIDDGPAVLDQIRSNPELEDIPVFFLTGVSDADMVRKALIRHPQGYILKPVTKEQLLKRLDSFWNNNDAEI